MLLCVLCFVVVVVVVVLGGAGGLLFSFCLNKNFQLKELAHVGVVLTR